jgi:hypothetical protein
MNGAKRLFAWAIAALALLYVAFCALLFFTQRSLIYIPPISSDPEYLSLLSQQQLPAAGGVPEN